MTRVSNIYFARLAALLAAAALCVGLSSTPARADDNGVEKLSITDLTGLWWVPSQPGWGLHLTHIGKTIFGAWFTYDERGNPTWYVASNCAVTGTVCAGDLYETELAVPSWLGQILNFDSRWLKISKVGTFSIDYTKPTAPVMRYELKGRTGQIDITKQIFRAAGVDAEHDWNGMWWNPGQNGWGLTVTQQHDVAFLAWYTYDMGNGMPTWHVVSNCEMSADHKGCSGDVYHTGGPAGPLAGATFDPQQVKLRAIGKLMVTFRDSEVGQMAWNLTEGSNRSGVIDLYRLKF